MSKLLKLLSSERLQPKISGLIEDEAKRLLSLQGNLVEGDGTEDSLRKEAGNFLDVLFNNVDLMCLVTNPKNPTLFKLEKEKHVNELATHICVNPMRHGSTRQSGDVTVFRNFLIEFDEMPIEDQFRLMEGIGFPASLITHSGNKSLHFIISLETPVDTYGEYMTLSTWLQAVVEKYVGRPDKQTRFPSAMTRFPNVLSIETGKSQKLIKVGKRISQDDLFEWLEPYQDLLPTEDFSKNDQISKRANLVDWYINDYLKSSYDGSKGFYECPICKHEGINSYGKKLMVTGEGRSINCLHRKDHNPPLLKFIIDLRKNVQGGQNE